MEIVTRDFGTVEVAKEDIVTFVQPIFGFENLEKYVFLFDQVECPEFTWLQSIEDKDVCFVLADPRILNEEYKPKLPADLKKALGKGSHLAWVITVVHEDFIKSTVNLRSPIIVNTETRLAAQIILESNYPIRQPII